MTEAGKLPPPLPPRLDWFVQTQMGQLAQGGVPAWFHGAISREDAEKLLEAQPLGCFLIRVSHSHVGYTLSYKARSCCHHVMVKLLDDGSFVIPGEERAHASLDALVAFHQQQPGRLHGEWLTQPCGQKDPANVDYEDLFLYSNALVEEAASPAHGPGKHQNAPSCPVASPGEASAKPVLLHRPKERTPSAEMHRAPTEEATSSCPRKAPLEKACRKLWKNLKTVPQTGKRVQQQLKSHLEAASFSSLWDPRRSPGTHSTRAPAGDAAWEVNAHMDPFVPQALRDRGDSSRKASRSASWSEVTPSVGGWHQVVLRTLSSQVSKPEPRDLAEAQKDWLPEEYCPPPPFAPGYC
ncbi:hematopoietic SH2 domain-containing protein isoform X1 [Diceros bicornis minor]|uniref:hematopoietic SH2 domain-containing protein isoform X1 n=1 Tax=Diceros bicornis minor TaxID=77932 RepID=UPI0026ED9320|nr:hematopoietic SH2 domain-containing protein isoform X1 [Diceros bicornis minor]XP_058419586.1 hematopoietic SH2 domain-containing protein isoform X1 [Diceros bicornis minor]XP_058419587.1 hematopoietic SH2 domain-containing protein isoform X1 [Diceros bicornis minor]